MEVIIKFYLDIFFNNSFSTNTLNNSSNPFLGNLKCETPTKDNRK